MTNSPMCPVAMPIFMSLVIVPWRVSSIRSQPRRPRPDLLVDEVHRVVPLGEPVS